MRALQWRGERRQRTQKEIAACASDAGGNFFLRLTNAPSLYPSLIFSKRLSHLLLRRFLFGREHVGRVERLPFPRAITISTKQRNWMIENRG